MVEIEVNIMEVIEKTSKIGTGHLTEVEEEIQIVEGDSVGIKETADLGIEVDPCLWIKNERRYHYCRQPRQFIREYEKKKRDQGK